MTTSKLPWAASEVPAKRDTFDRFQKIDNVDDLEENIKEEIDRLEKAGAVFLNALYKGMPVFDARPGPAETELKSWGYKKKVRKLGGRKAGHYWSV